MLPAGLNKRWCRCAGRSRRARCSDAWAGARGVCPLTARPALGLGLPASGCEVLDIGLALSPMAYFAQFDLDAACVAMVTASHNENGWTGVKMGANRPLTFGPEEIGRLKEIVLQGQGVERPGGRVVHVEGMA